MQHVRILAAVALLCIASTSLRAEELEVFNVWPANPSGETGEMSTGTLLERGDGIERTTNVTQPTVTVYPAKGENRSDSAVIVCPGGGYSILASEHEGSQVAEYLNSVGVTAFVLKYRVPRRPDLPKHLAPLQDAQRTLRLVRAGAEKWNISPDKIGILGFSAGGHLTIMTATSFDTSSYEAIDEADKLSCRPDFAVPIYPAYIIEKGGDGELVEEVKITKDTPPMFLAHADNDPWSAVGSARVYIELHKNNIPCELHVYAAGGHGFGMKDREDEPVDKWYLRMGEWMQRTGLANSAP